MAAALGLAKAGNIPWFWNRGKARRNRSRDPDRPECLQLFRLPWNRRSTQKNAVYIDRLRLMDALSGENLSHSLDEDFWKIRILCGGSPGRSICILLEACRSSEGGNATRHVVCGYRQDENTVLSRLRTVMRSKELPDRGGWSSFSGTRNAG